MKQYEVWWASLPQPIGRRPVVKLQSRFRWGNQKGWRGLRSKLRQHPHGVPLGAGETDRTAWAEPPLGVEACRGTRSGMG